MGSLVILNKIYFDTGMLKSGWEIYYRYAGVVACWKRDWLLMVQYSNIDKIHYNYLNMLLEIALRCLGGTLVTVT